MKRSWLSPYLIVPVLVLVPVGYRAMSWMRQSSPAPQFAPGMDGAGRVLFVHEWTPNDPLAHEGDGLGPVFNAKSCVACHKQSGLGGGGPLENNVTAFTQRSATAPETARGDTKQGTVHIFATSPEFRETLASVSASFQAVSQPLLADMLPTGQQGCQSPPKIGVQRGIDFSQRNTPALFGSNLIDAIPDRLIIANERAQRLKWGLSDSDTEEVPVGRAIRLSNGHVGKFGWKANIATLSEFVRAACANELGLGNATNAQPVSLAKRDYRPKGLDLTEEQCDQISAFVSSLPRPIESPVSAAKSAAGKHAFSAAGCADCHIPDVGEAKGIYSDLLLHRMGKQLVGGGAYGDPPPEVPDFKEGFGPDPSEWRTPPLWGVADSAPYMHDGRADSLEKAIESHGGQAKKSLEKYHNLSTEQRQDLVAFLKTLHAPKQEQNDPDVEVASRAGR